MEIKISFMAAMAVLIVNASLSYSNFKQTNPFQMPTYIKTQKKIFTMQDFWEKIKKSKQSELEKILKNNQSDIRVFKYILEKMLVPSNWYNTAENMLKNKNHISQEIELTPYFYIDYKILKEQYLVDHALPNPSLADTENVKSLLTNRFVTKRFDKNLKIIDKIQIVRCVSEWKDKNNGIVPVKNWIVTEDMKREFGALQNFFDLPKVTIRTGSDLAKIRDAAQAKAAQILSEI